MRYNVSDKTFLQVYMDTYKEGGTMTECVQKLRESHPDLPEQWATQRLAILRKKFKEQSNGTKTLPSLQRGRRSISDLVNLFGVEV